MWGLVLSGIDFMVKNVSIQQDFVERGGKIREIGDC